jgi:hypothetical protein
MVSNIDLSDIEGGLHPHELIDEELADISSAKEELIAPKCISVNGRSRRLSQCGTLPTRRVSRRDSDVSSDFDSSIHHETTHDYRRGHRFSIHSDRSVHSDTAPFKRKPRTLPLLLFALLTATIIYLVHSWRVQHLHAQLSTLHIARRSIEESHDQLSKELKEASHNMAQYDRMKRLKEEHTENLSRRVEEAERKLVDIAERIRRDSAKRVAKEFGGANIVELDVSTSSGLKTIQLEMASIDVENGMPHSVYTFLEQVQSKVWDGASLTLRGRDLRATVDGKPDVSTLLFPEFNNAHPHAEYTVSYADSRTINIKTRSAPKNGEVSSFASIKDDVSRSVVEEMKQMSGTIVIREARIVRTE